MVWSNTIKSISQISTKTKVFLFKLIIHLSASLPLINLYYLAFYDKLGADPVEQVINFTGIGAFNLLLLTLAVSPVAKQCRQAYLMKVRRLLGLYGFSYAWFHVTNFLAFDLQFAWGLFVSEIIKRPYITVGMFAFVLLSILAITSYSLIKTKLGKTWQKLHNINYLIILLVAVHFYWSVKSELISPLFYFLLVIILLLFRYKKLKRLLLSRFR